MKKPGTEIDSANAVFLRDYDAGLIPRTESTIALANALKLAELKKPHGRGRPELTHGQRIESDRVIVDPVRQMIDERRRAGDTYRKARAHAIKHAADVTRLDESVIRKAWQRWEPYYRAVDKINRENERILEALRPFRTESPGKKIGE